MIIQRPGKYVVVFTFAVILSFMLVLCGCEKLQKEDTAPGPEASGPEVSEPEKHGPKTFNCKFKADFVQKMKEAGGWKTIAKGTTWENCSSTRTETSMDAPGMPAPIKLITITRPDLNLSWQIFEKSKKYVERPLDQPVSGEGFRDPSLYKKVDVDYERVGTETVNGHDCVKYRGTVSISGEGPQEFYVWSARDLKDLIIKKEFVMADGSIYSWEIDNIELGEQSDDVFEIPAGYTKASDDEIGTLMMMEVMGGKMPSMPIVPSAEE
ncbi:MAG: DUF4412 domain-containing protein [Deltaproteobacteria bacterium]|uniref:DUF4412 domain-containing protein n=1 Tax=Candidatus Zymogenus saltonus TaxID=2844893 RepID=A0A9D8KH45_9DELT|nr:DUF4412 domain-containing protein [Candidatus Zymogenus saltonus]